MYENAPKGNKVTYIHYFGIKFAEEIRKNSLNEIVKYANISKSYVAEIAKAISLADVLNQNNIIQYNHNSYKNKENQNLPLNQILYGSPGTGKTYHTIDKALEILDENLVGRDEKKYGISQSDLYQMFAYANKYEIKEIYLIYPLCERTFDLRGKLKTKDIKFLAQGFLKACDEHVKFKVFFAPLLFKTSNLDLVSIFVQCFCQVYGSF
ncbi:hypothetical protein L8Y20_01640 [Campylobacter lari]|uniref:HTH-like domain-containing protein n=3 Tax=Campylobacter lari TaxID=201 RepID=B9KEV3_CAMLR